MSEPLQSSYPKSYLKYEVVAKYLISGDFYLACGNSLGRRTCETVHPL